MKIIKQGKPLPLTIMVHGLHGLGKTTLGTQSRRPIFITAEDLSHVSTVDKFPTAQTFGELQEQLKDVLVEKHDYKTLVIDTLDSVEKIVYKSIIGSDPGRTIAESRGGFGKGYIEAEQMARDLLKTIDQIRTERSMDILLLAHSLVESVEDPFNKITYNKYCPKLQQSKSASFRSVFTEYVQCLFYLTFDISLASDQKDSTKIHAESKQRVFITQPSLTCDAKNRFGFPEKVPYREEGTWEKIIRFVENFYAKKGEKK